MQPSSSWPNDVAYLEAIQTPSVCFSEPRLKAALIYSNDMGMPQAATGRSAIVFRADVDSADVALRCFTREAEGQQKRYQDLHEHLAHSIPRYMVDFIYWDREILVDGTRYPVVEMGWVEGQPLHLWVEQHLQRPYHLVRLAAIWLKVVEDLHARRMAHGDLSSDNCLVTGHKLKLIDYDDFFISRLAAANPGEAGNPHFQHPHRPGYYALNMDNFPALVIYLSLLALAADPSLWRFHNGKNLIFTDADYLSPNATPIWTALAQNPDKRIKPLVTALAEMCTEPIEDLPPLGQLTTGSSAPWWLTPAAWRSLVPGGAHESAPQQPGVPPERPREPRRRIAWLAAGAAGLVVLAVVLTLVVGASSAADQAVRSAAFSGGGNTLAAGNASGSIYLWDVAAKTLAATLKTPTGQSVNSAAFSPDGKTLAAADADGNTYLWYLPANSLTYAVPDPGKGAVVSVAFSPDGTTLATADAGGNICLWDLPGKSLTATLPNPGKRAVVSVAFSLGGTTLTIVDAGAVAYLWTVPAKPPS